MIAIKRSGFGVWMVCYVVLVAVLNLNGSMMPWGLLKRPALALSASKPVVSPLEPGEISSMGFSSQPEVITGTLNTYLPIILRSGTRVCGEINTNTTWTASRGPYVVTCDVSVASGVALTITPGTRVQFTHSEDDLFVYGVLQARGSAGDPIWFQSLNEKTRGSWGSVRFQSGSSGILENAILEYGGYSNGMLSIASDDVHVIRSTIQYSYDTGIFIDAASPRIEGTLILNNWGYRGGGLFNNSGNPTIQNNKLSGNTSIFGGGLYNDTGSPIIGSNLFTNNMVYGEECCTSDHPHMEQDDPAIISVFSGAGGGVYSEGGNPIVQNNIFSGNVAVHSYYDSGSGGGLFIASGRPVIQYNTIVGNVGSYDGGGILLDSNSHPVISGNIVANNQGGGLVGYEGVTPEIDYNDIWNNTGGNYVNVAAGIHDISIDPLLADSLNGNFHLTTGSPCIDSGDPGNYPEMDFEDELRPGGPWPDIGADEFRSLHLTITSVPETASPGDPISYIALGVNYAPDALTSIQLTDTLPVELTFAGYQSDSLDCTHDGSSWGGQLSCSLSGTSLSPDQSFLLTINAVFSDTISSPHTVTNTITVTARADQVLHTIDQWANTRVSWCAVQLNNIPMGSDIQAAITASTLPSDVVKVSGSCPTHDLNLNKTLILQGGWSRDFSERDLARFTTTLDGQGLVGRVIQVQGAVDPVIEGFVITGGNVAGVGGGINIVSGSPTIQNNSFVGNVSIVNGGGLANGSGSPIIQNNLFTGNSVLGNYQGGYGGGVYNDSGNPRLENNVFTNNHATNSSNNGYGGGLANHSGNPHIENNTFTGNEAPWGGGIFTVAGNPFIAGNSFSNNLATVSGGGLYNDAGAAIIQSNVFFNNTARIGLGGGLCNGSGPALIQNNMFSGNSAGYLGGGLDTESGNATIQNNTFTRNYALHGGGLSINYGSPTVQNNIIFDNSAENGGGIYHGGDNSQPIVLNNTIFSNSASFGGGVYIEAVSPVIRGNIVVSNTAASAGGGIYNDTGAPIIDYNDVWSNFNGDYYNASPGAHDISVNPLLKNPDVGDIHLLPGSACIDAGDPANFPSIDFEGDPRPQGAAPDIGADEYRSTRELSPGLVHHSLEHMSDELTPRIIGWQYRMGWFVNFI